MGANPRSLALPKREFYGKSALLTGANGFLGTEIAMALRPAQIQITRVVRLRKTGIYDALVAAGDLADRNFLLSLPWNFDVVIHAAAAWKEGSDFQRDNVRATQNLVEMAKKFGCRRFIFISSTSVHGGYSEPTLRHSSPLSPDSEYGKSKVIAESLVKSAPEINPIIVRLPGVVGPGAHSGLLPRLAAAARENEDLRIYNASSRFNSIVSSQNVANFVASLATSENVPVHGSIILGSSDPLPMSRLARAVIEETGSLARITPVYSPRKPYLIDYSFAEEFYGFVPEPVNKVILDFLNYRSNSFHRG